MMLLSQTGGGSSTALFLYRTASSNCGEGIWAVLIIAVLIPVRFLFRLILPADQILLRLLWNVAATELIGADPGDCRIPVWKNLFFYAIRDFQFIADDSIEHSAHINQIIHDLHKD